MTTTFSHAELEAEGFSGWVPLATLDTARVPAAPGVYLVYRVAPSAPKYLATSAAGRFKSRDPSVDEIGPPIELGDRREHPVHRKGQAAATATSAVQAVRGGKSSRALGRTVPLAAR